MHRAHGPCNSYRHDLVGSVDPFNDHILHLGRKIINGFHFGFNVIEKLDHITVFYHFHHNGSPVFHGCTPDLGNIGHRVKDVFNAPAHGRFHIFCSGTGIDYRDLNGIGRKIGQHQGLSGFKSCGQHRYIFHKKINFHRLDLEPVFSGADINLFSMHCTSGNDKTTLFKPDFELYCLNG